MSICASSVAKRGARQCLPPIDIDQMLELLAVQMTGWADSHSEEGFIQSLDVALTYLAAGVAPQAREYALRRTGRLIAGSGSTLGCSLRSLGTMNGHGWAVTEASAESPPDHPRIHGN